MQIDRSCLGDCQKPGTELEYIDYIKQMAAEHRFQQDVQRFIGNLFGVFDSLRGFYIGK